MARYGCELQSTHDDLRDDQYWGGLLNSKLPLPIDYKKWECFGIKKDGEPIVTWAYHSYADLGNNRYSCYEAEMAIVAFNPRWATKGRIKAMLALFFCRNMYNRLTALILIDNRQAVKLVELAGFTLEGIIRKPSNEKNIMQYSLLREDWQEGKFRWAE